MPLRIIRFSKNNLKKYRSSIRALRYHGPVVSESRPYIGMLDVSTKKIISCIWIDETYEISIITHGLYRKMGIMSQLIEYIKSDVYLNKLDEVNASPISSISRKLLRKKGFKRTGMPGYYEYSVD
jgi:hypothetical protein